MDDLNTYEMRCAAVRVIRAFGHVVTDRRVLRGMERAAFILPVPEHCRPRKSRYYYVETAPGWPPGKAFEYKGQFFALRYASGCFFPFVHHVECK